MSVRSALSSAPVVGFSGSRSPSSVCVAAVRAVLPLVRGRVVVGCARGVDAVVRASVPAARLRVFRASAFGSGRGAPAARSVACVRAVAAAGGVWVSCPGRACPAGLVPSRSASACFSGRGSGSWASLALAAGLGVACLVFLPPGVAVPPGWGFRPLGGGWYWRAGARQLGLF